MTLPNLSRTGKRSGRRQLLTRNATKEQVSVRLSGDIRYSFLKTQSVQFERFSSAIGELLAHYSQTVKEYIAANRESQIDACSKPYETAIEQLLEKAYQEAKAEDMKARLAQLTPVREIKQKPPPKGSGCQQGKRLNFRREQVECLSEWFEEHVDDPYPDPNTKYELAQKSGLSFKQVSNWFINARSRRLSSADKKKLKRVY